MTTLTAFPFNIAPLNNITPFTYRDGTTFVEILYALRDYINLTLRPEFDAEMSKMYSDFQTGVSNAEAWQTSTEAAHVAAYNAFTTSTNAAITAFETNVNSQIAAFEASTNTSITTFENTTNATVAANLATMQTQFNAMVATINTEIATISNRVGPVNMQRLTLTADTTITPDVLWPSAHPIDFQITQDATGGHNVTFGGGVTGSVPIDPTPNAVTEFELWPDGAGGWHPIIPLRLDALRQRAALNILDYGVHLNATTSQTAAIKAALDANPGKEFYFPPGDYRLDTGLVINNGNSLIGSSGARLYAGTAMTTLVTHAWTGTGYAEDKGIIGLLLDGNLLAQRALSISKVIRFTLRETNFKDFINRGLVTEAGLGAELIASNLRFYNTTNTNVTDNIAIEANMGDSHFRDIITRSVTVGIKDTAANRWDRIHPWIDQDVTGNTQMTSRYPTSIGFDLTGSSDLQACVADTMRYAYKLRTVGGFTQRPRLLNCRAAWAQDPVLPTALATANPAFVFDNTDGVGVICDRFTMTGHSTVPVTFLTAGSTSKFTCRNSYSYGYVLGPQGTTSDSFDFVEGVQRGVRTFTPTIYGSGNAGTHAYTTQSGRMVVNDFTTTYFIRVAATLDATTGFSGSLRIGGIPAPYGAASVRDGAGSVGLSTNAPMSACLIYASPTPFVTPIMMGAGGTSEIDIPANSMRGKVVDIMLAVTVTHIAP